MQECNRAIMNEAQNKADDNRAGLKMGQPATQDC